MNKFMPPLTLTLSQWERGFIPFSLGEKGRDEGGPRHVQLSSFVKRS
jgi:hypothetical protein